MQDSIVSRRGSEHGGGGVEETELKEAGGVFYVLVDAPII
jgi:hypothetical protein